MSHHYEVLPDPSAEDLRQIEPIYRASFPPAELAPFPSIVRAVREGINTLVISRQEDAISAFALIHWLPGSRLIFMPYMAVARGYQNQGIGSGLVRYIVDELLQSCEADALIWEVEVPEPDDPAGERSRRVRFYEQLGAQMVSAANPHYCMPNPAGEGTVPLWLMWVPLCHSPEQPSPVETARWVRAIYAHDYANRPDLAEQIIVQILNGE